MAKLIRRRELEPGETVGQYVMLSMERPIPSMVMQMYIEWCDFSNPHYPNYADLSYWILDHLEIDDV